MKQKAEEIFNIKAEYNKWLKELTNDEKELVLEMINEALRMHDVIGRSETFVCGHPPKRTYLLNGIWHCEECGGKWKSIANK